MSLLCKGFCDKIFVGFDWWCCVMGREMVSISISLGSSTNEVARFGKYADAGCCAEVLAHWHYLRNYRQKFEFC